MTIFNKYFVLLYSPDLNDLVVFPIQFKTEKFGLKLHAQSSEDIRSRGHQERHTRTLWPHDLRGGHRR